MTKTLLKWLVIVILAFLAGFVFKTYTTNKSQAYDQDIKINGAIFKPIAYRNTDQKEMNDDTKKAYHRLISEYFNYIKGSEEKETSFADFISIRRDQLVQQGKYTDEDEKVDKQVLEWYSKLNEINKIPGYEVSTYQVAGTVLAPDKSESLCSLGDRRYLNILVAVYLNQPSQDYYPATPKGAINPEQPLDYSIVDCENGNFQLSFILGNQMNMESPPVYIVAYAFSSTTHNYLTPIAIGTDKRTSGLPPSFLSKRKTNQPVVVKLHSLKNSIVSSDINLQTSKGAMVTPYGLDGVSALMKDFKTFRTTLSGSDAVARLKSLPIWSNLLLDITDKKDGRTQILVPVSSDTINIDMSSLGNYSNGALIIIPPANIKEGELLLFSKTNKNRKSFKFNNQERNPFVVEGLSQTDTFLELRSDYQSLGLMPVNIRKDISNIIEPTPKHIEKIVGKLNLINSLLEDSVFCRACTISIKYTDKISTADSSGAFAINDINIIDTQAQVDIDAGGVNFIYPLIVHNPISILRLDVSLPSRTLLTAWNQVSPTIPGHGLIYGDYPKRSFHAFLVSLDDSRSIEAYYFGDKTSTPSKKISTTPYETSSTGFGKFLFSDIKPGDYVLYLISSEQIIHSRIIRVEANKVTLIN